MVSALVSVSSGPVSSPLAGDIVLQCVLGQDTLLFQCLFPPKVYKWVLADLMLGVTLRWTSIPSSGESKYS